MTPYAAKMPAQRSAIGRPTRSGPWPGKPVTDMSPPMPCAIWSKPGRVAYGPVCPKPEMLAYTRRGLIFDSAS